MRKWLLATGALVLVAATTTIWLVTRRSHEPSTAVGAVESTCHAQGATLLPPRTDPKFGPVFPTVIALRRDLIPVFWMQTGNKPITFEAAVRPTSSGGFEVVNCTVTRVD